MTKVISPADPQWTPARATRLGRVLLATGVAALGIQSLIHADLVSSLEPVPAWLPMRRVWACLIAGFLVIAAVGHLSKRHVRSAAIGLGGMFLLWLIVFHLPRLLASPTSMSAWVVACETAALTGTAWVLVGALTAGQKGGFTTGAAVAGRILFGLSLLLFGLSHFMYHDFVATLVPAWIPGRLFWAYFTGAAHIAAGLSILINVMSRLAAALYGVMIGIFGLLVNAPRAVNFDKPAEWDSLFVAVALSGAAWIIAGCLQKPDHSLPAAS
ncbi:MAG TPA: hypothetical protein VGP80_01940 [Gemmatimonadales bacterium]|nr:hypothetical protein [Gemmatimonadales bacterium]